MTLVELVRSKQDSIRRGHGAQYLHRLPHPGPGRDWKIYQAGNKAVNCPFIKGTLKTQVQVGFAVVIKRTYKAAVISTWRGDASVRKLC